MAELTLTGLRVVREVAFRGSFTAAAESLGYTQSAVSRQVAAMEAAAGAPLFRRGARGVELTDEGGVIVRHAVAALDQLAAARRELGGMREPAAGTLRVGAFPTAVAALLPRAIAAFAVPHPSVRVSLREGVTASQLRRLESGASDLAVVGNLPSDLPGAGVFNFEPLLDDPLLLAVGRAHPLARRPSVALDGLRDERWIAASGNPRDTFLGAWATVDWQPRVELVAQEWTAKLGLVAAGLGVTIVPGLAATAVREDVALVRIRSERPPTRDVLLATRAGAEPPAHARAFADALHQVAAELALELQRRIRRR